MWMLLGNDSKGTQECINSVIGSRAPILSNNFSLPPLHLLKRTVLLFCIRIMDSQVLFKHPVALESAVEQTGDGEDRRWTQGNVWSPARCGASNRLLCVPLLSGPWCGAHGNGMQRHSSRRAEKRGTAEELFVQITASILCPGYMN